MSLEEIFSRLDAELDRVAGAVHAPEVDPVEGASEDGRITATMAAGQIQSISIHPAAMRLTNAELADQIRDAVNATLAAYQQSMVQALSADDGEFGQLQGRLREISADAQQSMQAYQESMLQMLRSAT